MSHKSFLRCIFFCAPLLLVCQHANAWFFFWWIPPSGSGVDPDSIVVTSKDRLAGKCAGYHTNQINVRSGSAEQQSFHQIMSEKAIEISEDKQKVKELAEAYSSRWSKAAAVDMYTNRAYGRELATGCQYIGLPVTLAQQEAMKRQEEAQRQEEMKRQEEARRQEEANRKAAEERPAESVAVHSAESTMIDFSSEARKSARILGCNTSDPKVIGVEEKNVVFLASCEGGASLTLSCDPTGLCLKK